MTAQPTADQKSRWKCKTGQYHQVVAISEDLLNRQLETYYEVEERLHTLVHDMGGASIDAKLRPSRITIPINEKNERSTIIYHLRISEAEISWVTGSMSIAKIKSGESPPIRKDKVKDWDIPFTIDLGMEGVKEEERDAVNTMLRIPGDYSIQRLLLLFGTASLVKDPGIGNMKMSDGSPPPQILKNYLTPFLKEWAVPYNQIENRLAGKILDIDASTMAGKEVFMDDVKLPMLYHAIPEDPKKVNAIAPTFPPTNLTYQTYQFVRGDQSRPTQSGRNCFVYLEMCGIKDGKPYPLPANTNFGEDNGNFVTADLAPSAQIDGSMCFTRELLIENRIIPHLQPLIKLAELNIISVQADRTKKNHFQWDYSFGNNQIGYEDSYFKLKRQNGTDNLTDWFNNPIGDLKNPDGWRWVNEMNRKEDKYPGTFRDTSISLTGRSIVNLTFKPGLGRLEIRGCSTMEVDIRSKTIMYKAERSQIAISGNWGLDLVFSAIDKGNVHIKLQWQTPKFSEWQSPSNNEFNHVEGINGNEVMQQMEKKLTENIKNVAQYCGNLEKILENQFFVLSGGGYFFMKNPIFTENADLLVELAYDGITRDKEDPAKFNDPRPEMLLQRIGLAHPVPPNLDQVESPLKGNATVNFQATNKPEDKRPAELPAST